MNKENVSTSPVLVTYDQETGQIKGFYDTSLNYLTIPEPNIEITPAQREEYFTNGQNYKVIDGEFTYIEPEEQALFELQQQKWEEIKQARTAQRSTMMYKTHLLNTDAESFENLLGSAFNAKLALEAGEPYEKEWTTARNYIVTFTGEDFLAISETADEYFENIHTYGRSLRIAINQSQTKEEVEAIVWDYDNWPDKLKSQKVKEKYAKTLVKEDAGFE